MNKQGQKQAAGSPKPGTDDGRRTWGHSTVVGPWGEIIARCDDDAPGVLLATLDLDAVGRARTAVPQLRHDRAFAGPA